LVSGNYFRDLGIRPFYGRLLDDVDERASSLPVAVLGHAFWQSHFGTDFEIVGKIIRLNDKPVQVVGIAPPEFGGLVNLPTPVWMSISQYSYLTHQNGMLVDYATQRTSMFGRLKPQVSRESAEAQFRLLTTELSSEQPKYFSQNEWLKIQ